MFSLNKVQIAGNLGRDPETRFTSNGTQVCTVSLATSRTYKDKTGETVEKTEWHRVIFYARLAEVVAQYMAKGRAMYVEGRLQTRTWKDKDDRDVYATEVIAQSMQFVGSKPDGGEAALSKAAESQGGAIGDDDIPF